MADAILHDAHVRALRLWKKAHWLVTFDQKTREKRLVELAITRSFREAAIVEELMEPLLHERAALHAARMADVRRCLA